MTIRAEREDTIDYEETARIAAEAFDSGVVFSADHLRWFYERCFSLGTTVIALRDGERKVGQIALVRQKMMADGIALPSVQLVDLFVLKDFRGRKSFQLLYGEAEKVCLEEDIRFAIGMPNAKAQRINEFFFKLMPYVKMPLHAGISLPFTRSDSVKDMKFDRARKNEFMAAAAPYRSTPEVNGLPWDENSLYERLCGYRYEYGVHALDDVLLISSPRKSSSRGFSYTLLCGLFNRAGAKPSQSAIRAVVANACAMWGNPVFAFTGLNSELAALPGFRLPERMRPSPLLIQLRDFKPERGSLQLQRYQTLDFDFA